MPTEEEAKRIAESLELDGTLDEVERQHAEGLRKDPEWSTPKYVHVAELLTSFAVGVLSADPYHKGYKVPPDYEAVVNWIAWKIREKFGGEEVVKISLMEIREWFLAWGNENPAFRKWGEPKDPGTIVGVVSRYSSTPTERDFISLEVIAHNAALYIRNQRRKNANFDYAFEIEQRVTKGLEVLEPMLDEIPHDQQGHFPANCLRCRVFAAVQHLKGKGSA